MLKRFRGVALTVTAVAAALALAVPSALAAPPDTTGDPETFSGRIRPVPPVPSPLIVEPRCVPRVQPLAATPRPRFPHHKGGLAPDQSLPEAPVAPDQGLPEGEEDAVVDNTLPGDLPTIDNSLPGGERRRLLRLALLRRLCGETPPIDETRPEIRTALAQGARLQVVRHPSRNWFAIVNVASDLAFLRNGRDASPEWASATSNIVAGPGVVNSLVVDDRLVAAFSAPVAVTARVNDWFPSGLATPRENTPNAPGPGGACTSDQAAISPANGTYDGRYKLPALNSGSMFNTNTPGGCASGANLVRTPANDPGPSVGVSRSDWTNVGFGFSPAGSVRSVGVVRIAWADATQTTVAVTSNPISL